MPEIPQTVWILGSGFSQPLGGPLLDQLMAPGTEEDLQALKMVGGAGPDSPAFITRLFNAGRPHSDRDRGRLHKVDGKKYTRALWKHAEQFLEHVDRASDNPESVAAHGIRRLEQQLAGGAGTGTSVSLKNIAAAARRLVACQCLLFTEDADQDSEVWRTYKAWAGKLMQQNKVDGEVVLRGRAKDNPWTHVVATFNYDRVPEILKFDVHLPIAKQADSRALPAYKLHGSVGWKIDSGRTGTESVAPHEQRPLEALSADPHGAPEVAIAVPGGSKAKSVDTLFGPLWRWTTSSIEKANSVVFVGYRFPESDADAREKLLGALSKKRQPHLVVNIVLGPQTGSDMVVRMRELVRYALENGDRRELGGVRGAGGTYSLKVHPLYAQDFIALWEPRLTYASEY